MQYFLLSSLFSFCLLYPFSLLAPFSRPPSPPPLSPLVCAVVPPKTLKGHATPPNTIPVPIPPVEVPHVQARPFTAALPGFSGRFDDDDDGSSGGHGGLRVAEASSVDELADLSILGARLQKEKLKIHEDARAQRQPFVDVSFPSSGGGRGDGRRDGGLGREGGEIDCPCS